MLTTYREEGSGPEYYRTSSMHGGGWHSREDIPPGTVRVIKNILSKAWTVRSKGFFRKPEVQWIPVDPAHLREVNINERP